MWIKKNIERELLNLKKEATQRSHFQFNLDIVFFYFRYFFSL